jgi:hypothetical protein
VGAWPASLRSLFFSAPEPKVYPSPTAILSPEDWPVALTGAFAAMFKAGMASRAPELASFIADVPFTPNPIGAVVHAAASETTQSSV